MADKTLGFYFVRLHRPQAEGQRAEKPPEPLPHQVGLSRERQSPQKDGAQQVSQAKSLNQNYSFKASFLLSVRFHVPVLVRVLMRHAVYRQHLFIFFPSSSFSLHSVSPESALQWSSSFEELLKHSGQLVGPDPLSKPFKSAIQNSFFRLCNFFFFHARLHLN